jgi:hypothetical protein
VDERPDHPSYIALSHGGHGVNSWCLTCQLVLPNLGLFARTAWGGIYKDVELDEPPHP